MADARPNIRRYHTNDVEAVIDVWQRANALAHPFLTPDFVAEVHRAMRDIYLPNAETYVLEEGGAIVGFIALLGNEIGGLFLHPSLHGKGYGKALVDHAVVLKGPLKVDVFRDNVVGLPFYERYGFELVEEELHAPSAQIILKMAMQGA